MTSEAVVLATAIVSLPIAAEVATALGATVYVLARTKTGVLVAPCLTARFVILVDDGCSPRHLLRAAALVRAALPAGLVVAVPYLDRTSCHELERGGDELVCPVRTERAATVRALYSSDGDSIPGGVGAPSISHVRLRVPSR